jgi:hypothetical protein
MTRGGALPIGVPHDLRRRKPEATYLACSHFVMFEDHDGGWRVENETIGVSRPFGGEGLSGEEYTSNG